MSLPDYIDWLKTDECLAALESDEDFIANVRAAVVKGVYSTLPYAKRDEIVGVAVQCIFADIHDAWLDEHEADEHPAKAASDNIDAQERATIRSEI